VRSKSGVRPTEAGRLLYKHAQVMLRQLDLAEADIRVDGAEVAGQVCIGLAPFTASTLAVPLLKVVRERYPGIVLQIHENIGGIMSELIMTGQLDLAFIHDPGERRGVEFEPVLSEDLFLVCTTSRLPANAGEESVEFKDVAPMDLMMPRRINTVRQVVDLTFRRSGGEPNVIAELESIPTLALAVGADLGATVLPWSVASSIVQQSTDVVARRVVSPTIQVKVSMCTSQQFPLSEPALAVRNILSELAYGYAETHSARGVRAMQPGPLRSERDSPSSTTRKK